MQRFTKSSLLVFAALLLTATGCASKSMTERQINSLQAQVGVLTDELVRLDDALRETRSAIAAEENRMRELEAQKNQSRMRLQSLNEEKQVIQNMYRTPSGFELPSLSIQKALTQAGYYQGRLDGKIGSQTREAVRAFQRDHGLTADGVVGRQTWGKLKLYLSPVK